MQKKESSSFSIFVGIVLLAILVLSLVPYFEAEVVYPTAEEIAALVIIPASVTTIMNASDNSEELDEIRAKLYEDDDWEDEAEGLATEEYEESDYKDLYRAINEIYEDLDDRDEIEYVREDESTGFSGMDADDKDGTVYQYLKVKYEDADGSDQKVYLTVETTFEDGDLEDQEIYETA